MSKFDIPEIYFKMEQVKLTPWTRFKIWGRNIKQSLGGLAISITTFPEKESFEYVECNKEEAMVVAMADDFPMRFDYDE